MEPKTILILVAIVSIFAGAYAIYGSIKNTHKNHSHRRLKNRTIQQLLGVDGARIFYGILGTGLLVFGLLFFFNLVVAPMLGDEYNNKTDEIVLVSKTTYSGNFSGQSTTYTTVEKLRGTTEIMGNNYLDDFIKISFKDNYRESLPDIVWEIKNVEIIDLTNNKISEIDSDKLSSLEHLKTLILTNNPISSEKIEEIRTNTVLEVKN